MAGLSGRPGEPLIAGIDAGTSRIRALIFTPDGSLVATGARPTPVEVLGDGRAEHDMQALLDAALQALEEALAQIDDRRRLRSIATASFGEAGTLVDCEGTPLTEVLAWYDTRTKGELDQLLTRVNAASIAGTTGLCPDPTFTLLKLLWLRRHRPDAWSRAARWLNVGDFIAFSLSGVMATETSLASRTMALDLAKGSWATGLLAEAGIAPSLLPELRPMGSRLSTIRPGIARRLGLDQGCIIATGGHDHVAGVIGVAADRPGVMLDSMGTAEASTFVVTAPIADPEVARLGLNQGLIRTDRDLYYVFGGLPTSAAAIEWFRAATGDAPHADLIAAAGSVPPGSHGVRFLPHLRLGSPPYPDPVSRGLMIGIGADTGRDTLYRAVLEGVALDTASIQSLMLARVPGTALERLLAIGGSTRNPLLMRLKAALACRPIDIAEMPEAVALGAAILGATAAGIFPTLSEAQAAVRPRVRTITPDLDWPDATSGRALEDYRELHTAGRALQGLPGTRGSSNRG